MIKTILFDRKPALNKESLVMPNRTFNKHKANKFRYRGRTHLSIDEAAAELGVSPSTLRSRVKRDERTSHQKSRKNKSFTYRGKVYKSYTDASWKLGVSVTTIQRWAKLEQPQRDMKEKKNYFPKHGSPKRRKVFKHRGKVYKSYRDAARALGVSTATIREWSKLDQAEQDLCDNKNKRHKTCSFTYRGKVYKSYTDASWKLGVSAATIQRWAKLGQAERDLCDPTQVKYDKRKPFTYRGVEYDSQKEAARVLGVSKGTISNWAKLNSETRDLKTIDLGERTRKPFTYRGVVYDSQREAAKALGVSVGTINKWSKLDQAERDSLDTKVKRYNSKPFTYRGVVYNSQREAAKALGIALDTIHKWSKLEQVARDKKEEVALPEGETVLMTSVDGRTFSSIEEIEEGTGLSRYEMKAAIKEDRLEELVNERCLLLKAVREGKSLKKIRESKQT